MAKSLFNNKEIVLASNSPRRKEILLMMGFDVKVVPSFCDETSNIKNPKDLCMELSKRKAMDVALNYKDALVLGADTIVAVEDRILFKPKDKDEALLFLKLLSGREHKVFTGVTLCKKGEVITFCEETRVEMFSHKDEILRAYIDTNDPMDKAGAYGIQGPGAFLVKKIQGDFYNVMGLPISSVINEIIKRDF